MATYTTRVTLTEDRKVTVEVPEDMPLGEAEVTVCVEEEGKEPRQVRGWPAKDLLAWLEARKAEPKSWTPRTKEEIDAEINAMRDEWDDD
jgi:hypothetical protein